MYANNSISKRRPEGWAERRRHFQRLFDHWKADAEKSNREKDSAPSDFDEPR